MWSVSVPSTPLQASLALNGQVWPTGALSRQLSIWESTLWLSPPDASLWDCRKWGWLLLVCYPLGFAQTSQGTGGASLWSGTTSSLETYSEPCKSQSPRRWHLSRHREWLLWLRYCFRASQFWKSHCGKESMVSQAFVQGKCSLREGLKVTESKGSEAESLHSYLCVRTHLRGGGGESP